MKYIFFFFSFFFLFGCGNSQKEKENQSVFLLSSHSPPFQTIHKPEYHISLSEQWHEIPTSSYSDPLFRQQNIETLFRKEAPFSPVFLLVTTESVPKSTTSLEFFSGTRENERAAFFEFSEYKGKTLSNNGNAAQILHFSARKTPSSPPLFFWQLPLVRHQKGLVFTIAAASPDMAGEAYDIFSNIL